MSFGPTVTPLTATQVDATTLVPLSKDSARNEIKCDEFLDALLLVANAQSVAARSGDVFCVRQPGGTPGTDELQLYNDGTNSYIHHSPSSNTGELRLYGPNGNSPPDARTVIGNAFIALYCGDGVRIHSQSLGFRSGNAVIGLSSTDQLKWSDDTTDYYQGTPDAGMKRAAASVVRITDGGTAGGTLSSVMLSPAQLTGNTNNWNPGTARYIRVSSDGAYNITGLVAGVDGQEVRILNVGANTLTLVDQSGSSTASNRWLTHDTASIDLNPNEGAWAVYDATTARWRVWKMHGQL